MVVVLNFLPRNSFFIPTTNKKMDCRHAARLAVLHLVSLERYFQKGKDDALNARKSNPQLRNTSLFAVPTLAVFSPLVDDVKLLI
jgi:hypothetical protein